MSARKPLVEMKDYTTMGMNIMSMMQTILGGMSSSHMREE